MPPDMKCTTPDGVPAPGPMASRVAVIVTTSPKPDGMGDEITAMRLLALMTTWGLVESSPALERKAPSPEYEAVTVWLVTSRVVLLKVAMPSFTGTSAANTWVPSRNVTVPLGL